MPKLSDQRESRRLRTSTSRTPIFRRRQTSHCHGYAPRQAPTLALPDDLWADSDPQLFRTQHTLFSVWRLMSVDDVNDYIVHLQGGPKNCTFLFA